MLLVKRTTSWKFWLVLLKSRSTAIRRLDFIIRSQDAQMTPNKRYMSPITGPQSTAGFLSTKADLETSWQHQRKPACPVAMHLPGHQLSISFPWAKRRCAHSKGCHSGLANELLNNLTSSLLWAPLVADQPALGSVS